MTRPLRSRSTGLTRQSQNKSRTFQTEALPSNRLVDHWIGESFEPEVRLDLYGPAKDLTKLEMGLWVPVDDKEALYLFALLTYVFPNEGDRPLDWMVENVTSALGGDRPSKRYGHATVAMSRLFQSYLVVTVTGVE